MSITAMAWAIRLSVGSPTHKLVLLAVANYADENGRCWPSQERLCRDTELAERSIRNALKELEEKGFLTRTSRHVNGNKRQTDIIQLSLSHRHLVPVGSEPPASGAESHRHLVPKPPAGDAGKPSIEPPEEEPSAFCAEAPKAEIIQFPKNAKGTRIPGDWTPAPELLAFGLSLGFSHEITLDHLAGMHDYFLAANGPNAIKRDWIATGRNWLRKAARDFQNARRPAASGHGASSGGRIAAMQRALARVADPDTHSE